jgi:cell division protease FtsH
MVKKPIVMHGVGNINGDYVAKNEDLHRLAKGLLEYETLTGEQIGRVIAGLPLAAVDDGMNPPPSSGGGDILAVPKTRARKPKVDPSPEPSA